LFVGIVWPSTALVLPWEQGPDFAAAPASPSFDAHRRIGLDEVAQNVGAGDLSRFYELAESSALSSEQALELARMLVPIWAGTDVKLGTAGKDLDAAQLMALWKKVSMKETPTEHGFAVDDDGNDPAAAGVLDFLDPRRPIQLATVLLMKDRAGTVGAKGVGP